MDEKKKFEDYMEDYNLAILPHKKYYDLKVYFFLYIFFNAYGIPICKFFIVKIYNIHIFFQLWEKKVMLKKGKKDY